MDQNPLPSPFEDESFLRSPESLPDRPRRQREALHGSARLAEIEDLRPWIEPDPREKHATLLHKISPIVEDLAKPEGLHVWFNQTFFIKEEVRNRHFLVVGQTGSGKTQGFVLPLLWSDLGDHERTVVVFDAKGELSPFVRAAAKRLDRKKPVIVLNFADRTRSVGWNPVELLPTDPVELESKAFDLAHALCWATEVREDSHDSVFFIGSAIGLIAGILQAVVLDPHERACLPRVREILELPRNELAAWLKEHHYVPGFAAFAAFIGSGSWNAETVLADAQMRLSAFRDHDLASVMSRNELDLDGLVDDAAVLVIEMREADTPRLQPVWNLFCTMLLDHFVRRAAREPGTRLPRPIALFLDELASSLGRMQKLEKLVNTLRQPRVGIVATVQSIGQLGHVYRGARDALLAGFNSKLFLGGLERVDAEYASAQAGTMSAEHVTTIEEPDPKKPGAWRITARHRSSVPRPLLTPDEIARPKPHFMLGAPATFFLAGTPPFQAYFRPAHQLPGPGDVLREIANASPAVAKRPIPLQWRPTRRAGAPVSRGVPESVLRARYQRLKDELLFERASVEARNWWRQYEERHRQAVSGLVELLEELKSLASTLDELHGARKQSRRDEPSVLVSFVRYLRSVKHHDALDQLALGWPPEEGEDERGPSKEGAKDPGQG